NVIYSYLDRTAYRAILNRDGSVGSTIELPGGYCADSGRLAQDDSGRFYVVTFCGRTLYVWATDRAGGGRSARPFSPTRLTIRHVPANWDYIAAPSGGTPDSQDYLDLVYPYRLGRGIDYVRLRLARRTKRTSTPRRSS